MWSLLAGSWPYRHASGLEEDVLFLGCEVPAIPPSRGAAEVRQCGTTSIPDKAAELILGTRVPELIVGTTVVAGREIDDRLVGRIGWEGLTPERHQGVGSR